LDRIDTNANVGDRALNKDIADAFCEECRSVFENWATCRIVFADLPSQAERSDADVLETPIGQCIERVYRMCLEAWISQVVRLNDPGVQRGNQNLSIDRLCGADGWTVAERVKIDGLLKRLTGLPKCLRAARDKIIAHNDLPTRLEDIARGGFPEGMDEHYFNALADLATMVWRKWCAADAGPLVKNQFFEFNLTVLEDDELSAICQARKLRACLAKGIQDDCELLNNPNEL